MTPAFQRRDPALSGEDRSAQLAIECSANPGESRHPRTESGEVERAVVCSEVSRRLQCGQMNQCVHFSFPLAGIAQPAFRGYGETPRLKLLFGITAFSACSWP